MPIIVGILLKIPTLLNLISDCLVKAQCLGLSLPAQLPPSYFMLLSHCLLGLVAAQVAQRKGRDLSFWLIWGAIGGTLALVSAIAAPALTKAVPASGAPSAP